MWFDCNKPKECQDSIFTFFPIPKFGWLACLFWNIHKLDGQLGLFKQVFQIHVFLYIYFHLNDFDMLLTKSKIAAESKGCEQIPS